MGRSEIRGSQIKDESIASVDIASGSIKAGEMSPESISGQTLITSTDTTNDRLLIWDATDSALKQVAPGNLGVGGGGGSGPAGANTQVQFNDGGANFGASSNFTYDGTQIKVSSTGLNPLLQLETSNDGTTASPVLELTRVSSSPADADTEGPDSVDSMDAYEADFADAQANTLPEPDETDQGAVSASDLGLDVSLRVDSTLGLDEAMLDAEDASMDRVPDMVAVEAYGGAVGGANALSLTTNNGVQVLLKLFFFLETNFGRI